MGNTDGQVTNADLNDDGYPDLVFMSVICWGGPDGYDEKRRTRLATGRTLLGSRAADLNRDGYLDLLYSRRRPVCDENPDSGPATYWGSGTEVHRHIHSGPAKGTIFSENAAERTVLTATPQLTFLEVPTRPIMRRTPGLKDVDAMSRSPSLDHAGTMVRGFLKGSQDGQYDQSTASISKVARQPFHAARQALYSGVALQICSDSWGAGSTSLPTFPDRDSARRPTQIPVPLG